MKENPDFKILYSQVAQQIIHGVAESFKSLYNPCSFSPGSVNAVY